MTTPFSGSGVLRGLSEDLVGLVASVERSVVQVDARDRQTASGVVWSADGLIVTADHVVQREEGIHVGLPDGRTVSATLVGRDPNTDVALLRAEATDLVVPSWGDVAELGVGQLTLAVARPSGTPMATIGVVSAFTTASTRRGQALDVVQTDVTLYPGFSGGALVDAHGHVVGLNSSALARGISTAIGVELNALWSRVPTCPIQRTFVGIGLSAHPAPPSTKPACGVRVAGDRKNSSTRPSRSGKRLPRKARSQAKRGSASTG